MSDCGSAACGIAIGLIREVFMYPFLLLLCFLFVSCETCGGGSVVYPSQKFTNSEENIQPCLYGDSLLFQHSAGVEFFLHVDAVYEGAGPETRCSPPEPQEHVEYRVAHLSSLYPSLDIKIVVTPLLSRLHDSYITVNGSRFTIETPNDQYETVPVILHGEEYEVLAVDSLTGETDVIRVNSILYSPQHGILQIGKSNGETFTRIF